jgi:hypothetical protein
MKTYLVKEAIMQVEFHVEYELVKERVYDDDIEVIAEYTYVVSGEWLSEIYRNHIIKMFDYEGVDLDEFLYIYDPDVEGTAIYYLAKGEGEIIEEGWSELAEY